MPHMASSTDTTIITAADTHSVVTQVRPSTLQATDQETTPNSHRHRQTPHRLLHSHLQSLAKLIARDKAVSTFWNCTRKPSKRESLFTCYMDVARVGLVFIDYVHLTSRVDIACPTIFLYPY
jgi:hypothetical protein